jgi:single-strand DNA-binding protein
MNSLKNRVQLIGNLGMDPEVKTFDSGKKSVRLSMATSESYKDADGKKQTETQWHNLVIWGKSVPFAEKYLKKGTEIAVEGKLIHRTYDDKSGAKKHFTEVLVNDIMILRSKKQED